MPPLTFTLTLTLTQLHLHFNLHLHLHLPSPVHPILETILQEEILCHGKVVVDVHDGMGEVALEGVQGSTWKKVHCLKEKTYFLAGFPTGM